jgi:hypothetical protein
MVSNEPYEIDQSSIFSAQAILYQETTIISTLIPNKHVKDHQSDSVNMMIKTESLDSDMSRTRVMDATTGWMHCTDNWRPLREGNCALDSS